MKKYLFSLLFVLLAGCVLHPAAWAAETEGTCGENVRWTLQDGVLTLSGTGHFTDNYFPNVHSYAPWYENKQFDKIYSIVIDKNIWDIGAYLFAGCENMVEVSFRDTDVGYVNNISLKAFQGCTSLERITVPPGWHISDSAFKGCSSLESFVIPDKIDCISPETFAECSGLRTIHIPVSIKSIEKDAFSGCSSLETVYYRGNQEEWNKIVVEDGNDAIHSADLRFESSIISYNLAYEEVPLYETDFQNREYTITLEDNPFFPYEVQFTVNGQAQTEWITNENDSVTISGYTFHVRFDGTARSLSFRVGEDIVQAYRKYYNDSGISIHKIFRNDLPSTFYSIKPLDSDISVISLTVNLRDRFRSELKNVTLAGIPEGMTAWAAEDSYLSVERSDKFLEIDKDFKFDRLYLDYNIIIGSNTLQDPNNFHYSVSFEESNIEAVSGGFLEFSLYGSYDGSERQAGTILNSDYCLDLGATESDAAYYCYGLAVDETVWGWDASKTYLALDFGTEELKNRENIDVTVYEGYFDSEEEALGAGAKNITSQIWRQILSRSLLSRAMQEIGDSRQLYSLTKFSKDLHEIVAIVQILCLTNRTFCAGAFGAPF